MRQVAFALAEREHAVVSDLKRPSAKVTSRTKVAKLFPQHCGDVLIKLFRVGLIRHQGADEAVDSPRMLRELTQKLSGCSSFRHGPNGGLTGNEYRNSRGANARLPSVFAK